MLARQPSDMLEWVSRDTLLDVSINAVPVLIIAYFVVLVVARAPWTPDLLVEVATVVLHLVPLVLLPYATYHVARAIERDAA